MLLRVAAIPRRGTVMAPAEIVARTVGGGDGDVGWIVGGSDTAVMVGFGGTCV